MPSLWTRKRKLPEEFRPGRNCKNHTNYPSVILSGTGKWKFYLQIHPGGQAVLVFPLLSLCSVTLLGLMGTRGYKEPPLFTEELCLCDEPCSALGRAHAPR